MDKKAKYEDALKRFKHSLAIKKIAEERIDQEFREMGVTGKIVSL